jgi:2-polyprenyl-3-methyl-5-hydroxy-6-metoxy-1,4-benzoquinol methylase
MFHTLPAHTVLAPRPCPACGADRPSPRFEKHGFHYVGCGDCGLVYISPCPVEQALEEGYEELAGEYYLDERRQAIDTYAERHRRELDLLKRVGASGRLLDVGCSTGSFLMAAPSIGLRDGLGIDIAKQSVDLANQRGVRAVRGEFPAGVLKDQRFDVVTMWNTLEHLPAPAAFLDEAFRVLEPGGWLAVSMPNFDSLSVALLGPKYRYIGVAHLNYFSPSTLGRLLTRCGFITEYTETRSFNPYVVWKDWSGRSPDTEELIHETELSKSFKTQRGFAPARIAYNVVDQTLKLVGKGDSLLMAARKPGPAR